MESLKVGDKVKVIFGVFRGKKGTVEEVRTSDVIISLEESKIALN